MKKTHTCTMVVEPQHLAQSVGSGDLPVLSTPMMMALMEKAAMLCIADDLDEGYTTVGGEIHSTHLKPTALGRSITACAELTCVEGRKYTFRISAHDEVGLIGEGTHVRFAVHKEKFMAKLS